MSTPTTSHPHHPGSASKKPTAHVTTPFGFSSPAPRSVPSPAATRKDQAGKTPINHPTTSSQGSKTIGSTPMVHNLSQTGNTVGSSPGANMLGSFGTPIGLGLEGITPSNGNMGMNMATPGMVGVAMSMTMSDLGLTASGGQKRNEDDERRAKMRKVLSSIGRPKGRVSEEGLARIGRRVGFASNIDLEKLGPEDPKYGNRVISIAGNKLIVDVDLKSHVPQDVQVVFDTQNESLTAQAEPASKVLLDDLAMADGVALNAMLDRFAANLERLARIDRLCANQVNCFEALSGVYTSLHRLYEQEMTAAKELDAMRKKSGWPTVHAHGRLGTAIEYWQGSAHVSTSKRSDDDMDVDQQDASSKSEQQAEPDVYRLRIGIESSPAGLYPSIRLSDTWLPDPLELPAADSPQNLPWQEPPPTFVSTGAEADAMAIDGTQKLPDLRFTAKLDPPIILPWQVASAVVQSVGLPAPQVFVMQAWHSLLLNPETTAPFDASKDALSMDAERSVLTTRDGDEAEVTHRYTLEVVKPDMAYKLEELPFSHPRQLVEMLSTLRQWACFGSLVRGIFADGSTTEKRTAPDLTGNGAETLSGNPQAPLSLADLLTPPTTPLPSPNNANIPVHISLITSPAPTLSLTTPSAGSTLANITVRVLPNAELVVTSSEGFAEGDDSGVVMDGVDGADADVEGKRMARALEVCGDLGVWVEWLRGVGK
ncbi:hypothetical protein LTR85_006061 [Meristemomyces frigidus]|nr:hypothetical protein LTR85_006061 [Meristemomyces frigidus]